MSTNLPSLLLIEDDPAQRILLAAYLAQGGFRVLEADSMAQARAQLARTEPSLALLDLNLPDGNGLDLLDGFLLRAIPVIILTCRPEDRIPALERGADDFLDKPFHPRELLARAHNLLRRRGQPPAGALPFRQDLERRCVVDAQGRTVVLTQGEFNLLHALVAAQGRVVSRADLLECISPDGGSSSGRSVDVLISRLRRKLEPDPRSPRLLLTALGLGYRLQA